MSNELNDFRRRIEVIAENECPEGEHWDVHRYFEKPFIVKVEDPNTKRWVLFDFRETLTDDDFKERMNHIKQKPEGEEG